MKVVIVGGGWAGSGAAMAAKNAGADEVVVLERTDLLLGTGLVGGIMRNNGRFTATEEAIAMGPTRSSRPSTPTAVTRTSTSPATSTPACMTSL